MLSSSRPKSHPANICVKQSSFWLSLCEFYLPQLVEFTEVKHEQHKPIDGRRYLQRVLASAPISPCRPAQRTHWSPTLQPVSEKKFHTGLWFVMNLCQIFPPSLISFFQPSQNVQTYLGYPYFYLESVFLTLRDVSHGLVTAPRSQAVIIIDLKRMKQIYFLQCAYDFSPIGEHTCVCRASPAHVSMSLHVPFVFSVADKLKERVPVSASEQGKFIHECK